MAEEYSLDPSRLPLHVGIIMDGNGRWATNRGLPRTAGHKEGLTTAKEIVRCSSEIGIKYLSLYTFSTENWRRAEEEVSFLMMLIKQHLKKEYDFYRENRIRVVHSGDLRSLPEDVQKEILSAARDTAEYEGLRVNLAINYGGRDEILRAFHRQQKHRRDPAENPGSLKEMGNLQNRESPEEKDFRRFLDQPDFPDMDLLIRTGGEMRISNFFIWQAAYAELYFDTTLWPDWGCEDLKKAVCTYQKRDRRFGGVKK